MGRKCLTCTHPKYREINRALVAGRQPLAEISRQFGISTDALRNHKTNCIHLNLRRAQERRDLDYAEELWQVFTKSVARLSTNIDDLEDVIAQTKKRKHYSTLIKALGETRSTLELAYKMMVSINATQRAEADIGWVLQDERLPEIIQDLSTPELAVFRKVLSKLIDRTSTPLLEVGDGPVMGVMGGGASEVEDDDLEADNLDVPLMVRTRFPRGDVEDLDHDNVAELQTTEQAIPESNGGEDVITDVTTSPPPPVKKWRPPLSQIHFADAQSFVGHLYRKRRGK